MLVYKVPVTVGLIYRKEFRRMLIAKNYKYIEEKGWLTSLFMIYDMDIHKYNYLINVVKQLQKE